MTHSVSDSPAPGSRWPLLAIVLVIMAVTLVPTPGATLSGGPCLICGRRGLADALLNIVLFVPFGAAFAWRRGSVRSAVLAALAFSTAIELTQFIVPGRDSTIADVVFNTLGSGLGAWLVISAEWWVFPTHRRSRWLAAASFGVVVTVLTAFAQSLRPAFPVAGYYGQWTPDFDNMEHYDGFVVSANIGDIAAPSTLIRQSDVVRANLLSGVPLKIVALAGHPPKALAPIFNFYDDRQREIVLLGADDDDAVFRYRTWSNIFKLDRSALRMPHALAGLKPGEFLRIEMQRAPRGFCVVMNSVRACPIGFTVSRTWSVLKGLETRSGHLERALDFVWLIVLFLPIGFWCFRMWELALWSVAGSAVLLLLPAFSRLLSTPALDFAAVLAGLALGFLIRRYVRLFSNSRSRSSSELLSVETRLLKQRSIRS